MVLSWRRLTILLLLTPLSLLAQARFDLPGPKIDIRVTRSGVMLPVASVPNLQPGDQVWLHPDFPASQSAHYLLIVAFLRGTTNPPPDNWFLRVETWDKKVRDEGVTVTVPDEAQQAILFLAPETGGDFSTLRSAVKGRPGVFVRASQDLAEAGFEQGRIEKYLAAMKQVPPGDPKALQEHSDLLARTLNLKPNPDCFKRPLDQQYNCLTQTGTQMLLDDGHAESVVTALSNGPSSDFINAASYTQLAGGGTYSAYVGAIVDLVRLTSGLHTAKYQYIPAIAFPSTDISDPKLTSASLDLRLNSPPSFNNPKSVIVIGLPSVQKSVPPPLRPVDPNHISCLLNPKLALPIDGAPLVFSTAFAHDLVLHLNIEGNEKDIPVVADAYQGGLVFALNQPERHELPPATPPVAAVPVPNLGTEQPPPDKPEPKPSEPPAGATEITGTIEGQWGFDHFTGPTLPLQQLPGSGWRILRASDAAKPEKKDAKADADTLIVGHPNHLQLTSSGTACVESIELEPSDSKVDWKLAETKPDVAKGKAEAKSDSAKTPSPTPVDLTLNLDKDSSAGSIHLAIQQFGAKAPDILGTTTFVEPARIEALHIHAGDTVAELTGASLDQVKSLTFKGLTYEPSASPEQSGKTLGLALPAEAKAPNLKADEKLSAEVHLRDGRTLPVSAVVLPSRPTVSILSRRVTNAPPSTIGLSNPEDLALGSQLTFFLKSRANFQRNDKIEIANDISAGDQPASATVADQALHTTLSIANGGLILEDSHTILATFDPLKTFGPSTFGPFHLRALAGDGTPGAWVPLATIVRLPTLSSLTCPADLTAACTLSGSSLYLMDSISLDPKFTDPTKVPEGFVDTSLSVPHPAAAGQPATYYLRLRDDPSTAQQVTLNVQSDLPPPAPTPTHTRGGKPAPSTSAAASGIPPSI
jgi:hypothetical protein